MALYEKKYPDYDTYRGKAYEASISFATLRTGLPPLDDFFYSVAISAVEFNLSLKGGVPLRTLIYREESWWGIIPTYTWKTDFRFYMPGDTEITFVIPPIVLGIIEAIIAALPFILIGIILWINLNALKEIFHSPGGEVFSWVLMLVAGAFLFMAVTPLLKPYIEKVLERKEGWEYKPKYIKG